MTWDGSRRSHYCCGKRGASGACTAMSMWTAQADEITATHSAIASPGGERDPLVQWLRKAEGWMHHWEKAVVGEVMQGLAVEWVCRAKCG